MHVVLEDLVFLLESMGLKTGINFDRLFQARRILSQSLPGIDLYGFTPEAGLPLGFEAATSQ